MVNKEHAFFIWYPLIIQALLILKYLENLDKNRFFLTPKMKEFIESLAMSRVKF